MAPHIYPGQSCISVINGPFYGFAHYKNTIENDNKNYKGNNLSGILKLFKCFLVFVIINVFDYYTPYKWSNSLFANKAFLYRSSFLKINFLGWIIANRVKFDYYFNWYLSDSILNFAGFGYDNKSTSKNWDKIVSGRPFYCEFAPNMQSYISNWNTSTSLWLRIVAYDRVPEKSRKFLGTVYVFILSVVIHGFYSGYYVFFGTCFLILNSYRNFRYNFKPYFENKLYHMCSVRNFPFYITEIIMTTYGLIGFVIMHFCVSFSHLSHNLQSWDDILDYSESIYHMPWILMGICAWFPFSRVLKTKKIE